MNGEGQIKIDLLSMTCNCDHYAESKRRFMDMKYVGIKLSIILTHCVKNEGQKN